MKLSELISKLTDIANHEGDLDVQILSDVEACGIDSIVVTPSGTVLLG